MLTTPLLGSAEGPWVDVMRVIGQAHTLLHTEKGVPRIQTDIRVGSRYVFARIVLGRNRDEDGCGGARRGRVETNHA